MQMTKEIIKEAVLTEQHCPLCTKLITSLDEVIFVLRYGYCITCDHVQSDYYEAQKQEEIENGTYYFEPELDEEGNHNEL